MATLANERTVRSFILGSAALSIPFLIAACITARLGRRRWYGLDHEIIPIAFSFITITTSALLSVLYFRRAKKEESGESAPVRKSLKVLWAFLDLANSFCYLGVLIPTWILEPRRLSTGAMMVETYATCFLIVNMIAHFYLGFYSFGTALKSCCFFPSECPNCHHSLRSSEPQMARPRNEREGYSLLRGEIYLDEDEDAAPIEQPSVSAEAPADNAEAEVGNVSPKPALDV